MKVLMQRISIWLFRKSFNLSKVTQKENLKTEKGGNFYGTV